MGDYVVQICTKCGILKLISEFHRRADGHRKDCKSCVCAQKKVFREKNVELIKERKRVYWKNNSHRFVDKRKQYFINYKQDNHQRLKDIKNKSAKKNREKQLAYKRHRYKSDPEFNLRIKIHRRIGMALRRINAGRKDRCIDLLGCTFSEFKTYFENLMTEDMSWDMVFNGEIHIDHIMPCSSFYLLDPQEQKKCFHYTNLQPLWAEDNMEKRDKINW